MRTALNLELELDIGGPGAGGVCVARHGERVVLVRHALPGERVRARVTEDSGGSFCRADAVEILRASADRVPPPCPHAGPGRCGGCDWQHASAPAQRALKGEVVRDQFRRLAGIDVSGVFAGVEELPGGLLGWRTRIAYAVAPDGRVGLRRHRSHEIEPVASCPLGAPGVGDSAALTERWDGLAAVEAVVDDDGAQSLVVRRARSGRGGAGTERELLSGPARMRHRLGRRQFQVSTIGFWQVHPHLLAAISSGLLDAVRPQPGETVLELYSGAGPLTAAFGDAVGPTGRVVGIEASRGAVWNAHYNLQDLPWASVRRGLVTASRVRAAQPRPDLVVLDPPRAGAGIPVIRAIIGRAPRAIGYVSCDPATLARDVRAATDSGWRLTALRAFDAFPMTHHVECLATMEP